MQEADLHVTPKAIEAMGFDVHAEGFRQADVRDVTLVWCEGPKSVSVVTYSRPVDDALTDADHVEWWERLDPGSDGATYLCEVVAPDLPEEAPSPREQGVAVQSVTPEDRGCTLTVVGSRDAIRRHVESHPGTGVDVPLSLRRLTDYRGPDDDLDALTARQREVLEAAYELGYYEVPREATADEIARRLDLDRSTVTEHLQRAERNLLSTVLSD